MSLVARSAIGPQVAAATIFFARVEEGSSAADANRVIPSTYFDGQQAYLLNCEPGRYVAVAGELRYAGGDKLYHVFLDEPTLSETAVTVTPGQMSFMGELLVTLSAKVQRADAAQTHFIGLVDPELKTKGYLRSAALEPTLYLARRVRLDQSADAEREFLMRAETEAFGDQADWQETLPKATGSMDGR